jgi:hypothetical protein
MRQFPIDWRHRGRIPAHSETQAGKDHFMEVRNSSDTKYDSQSTLTRERAQTFAFDIFSMKNAEKIIRFPE